ncbi:Zn-dependent protease [Flavobacterium sp. FlaQc-28]|uniref:Zn-dependent protease n=1 Tax=Flavobacterium sp. FlaQc-28 TaxID=3374178 RepID=UPI0037569DA4
MRYCFLVFLFLVFSCKKEKSENGTKSQKVIVIQPLGDFKTEQSQKVFVGIKSINPNVILRPNISFPENSYYKPRNRYRADSIIKSLKDKIGKDSVIVGLSNRDISTTYKGIVDWGVMGLGYRPGKACVVSDFRLSSKNKKEQFHKLVLHELGHTEGLSHCSVKTCLMRDAEGRNHLDEEKDFCENCKAFLVNQGWNLIL